MAKWKHWFPFESFRPYQEDTLCKITDAFKKHRFVIFQAPTGSGKSGYGVSLGDYFKPAYIATVEKHLQDQYQREFDLPVLKGKSNYECEYDFTDDAGRRLRNTCESAPCGLNVPSKAGKAITEQCKAEERCPYLNAKNRAFTADISLLNFANLLSFSVIPNGLPKKQLLVLDEAHKLEGELYKFAEVTFSPKLYQDLILDPSDRRILESGFKSVEDAIVFCEKVNPLIEDYYSIVSKNEGASHKELRRAEELLKQAQRKSRFVDAVKGGREFVLKPNDDGPGCKVAPLRVDHMNWLAFSGAEKILLMSATVLDPQTFAKSLGITDYEYIELPCIFPAKNRTTVSLPVGSMSYKNIQDTFPEMVKVTKKIVTKHSKEKGLIQTFNYRIASMLKECMDDFHMGHRFLFHTKDSSKDQLIQEHFNSPDPTILVGPGFKEGLDLKGDLCRWQAILKMPCADLKDPIVSRRSQVEPEWYALQTAMTLIQMLGRDVRFETDFAVHYILDSYFPIFYHRYKHLFPKDVRETIHLAEYYG